MAHAGPHRILQDSASTYVQTPNWDEGMYVEYLYYSYELMVRVYDGVTLSHDLE